ncbi:MAG: BatA domain-containing protein, partial [Planctomycetota bacterium]
MTWTTPGALWLLLSVPVLLWLEWRQRQRRIVPVATLALWRAVGSGAETARSDRRRWTLGTLLRVLAITAIAAAAAGPRGAARAPSPVVTLVIDASAASDWRGDDGRSALARSIEAAMSETLPTGAVPRYLIVPGDGAPVARPSRSELAGVTSTDLPLDWNVAIDAVLASAEAGPIHVYTPSAGPQRPGVTWHVMGSREGNAGITSLRLEETSDSGPRAFVRVRRIGEMSPEIEVELSVDDISREVKTITLEDGESRLVGFESEVTGSPVTVSLRPGGALSSDDRAWAFRTLSRPAVRIGVRAPEAVARAVRAAGLADVEIGESDSLRSGTAWIGLTDRPTPGPELVLLGAESGERVSVPGGVLTPEVGSALFRGVALAPLLVSSVREWSEGSSAEVVAWIEGPSDQIG